MKVLGEMNSNIILAEKVLLNMKQKAVTIKNLLTHSLLIMKMLN